MLQNSGMWDSLMPCSVASQVNISPDFTWFGILNEQTNPLEIWGAGTAKTILDG